MWKNGTKTPKPISLYKLTEAAYQEIAFFVINAVHVNVSNVRDVYTYIK